MKTRTVNRCGTQAAALLLKICAGNARVDAGILFVRRGKSKHPQNFFGKNMVHVFKVKNHWYIYDTGSSALHECDETGALLLREKLGEPADTSHISPEERAQYEEDFAELTRQGLLFKEEVKIAPPKSNEVKALCLHICHDCNLRCKYCFADEGAYHSRREFMSLETAKKAIDFLIENSGSRKILETDFFGGEPLMNFDVVKQTVYYAKEQAARRGWLPHCRFENRPNRSSSNTVRKVRRDNQR